MPRYFFNLRRDHLSLCDARGKECSKTVDALEHAFVAALALMARGVSFGPGQAGQWMSRTRREAASRPFPSLSPCKPSLPPPDRLIISFRWVHTDRAQAQLDVLIEISREFVTQEANPNRQIRSTSGGPSD